MTMGHSALASTDTLYLIRFPGPGSEYMALKLILILASTGTFAILNIAGESVPLPAFFQIIASQSFAERPEDWSRFRD